MATGVAVEEFITIVPVGESKAAVEEPAFVTVLTVGEATGAAEVSICRPKGARLGLGLKFEGGSAASEKVRRLLVQSCAEDSPAANACAPWGKLIPGDEILAIDRVSVSELTRIDCVRRLKDSDETLMLLVRHFESDNITQGDKSIMDLKEMTKEKNTIRPTMLPPPVPPRKLGKKNSFKDKPTLQTVGEQNTLLNIGSSKELENGKDTGNKPQNSVTTTNKLLRKSSFDSHILRQTKESFASLKKGSPEEARRLVRRLSDGKSIPPEADVYIDLLSNEWERCLILGDAESDDTGSSISTVVDRLGSMASSVENSIPSTPIMQPKSIDIQKVLNSIENIDTDILKDMRTAKVMDKQKIDDIKKIEKNVPVNLTNGNEKILPVKNDIEKVNLKNTESNVRNNITVKNVVRNAETTENCHAISLQDQPIPVIDKPKPMPRSTKVKRSASEKKRRPPPIPTALSTPIPEPLLTPTKKTCIESWLQRSEAEMSDTIADKIETAAAPEVLPRLIDFVPKTQFKEIGNDITTCTRPNVPPPPPPAETREDGSGASLDTIGELDETSDVTDSPKQSPESEIEKGKTPYDRTFWNNRVNKSDIEEKSLSNDESPLPTCPRQPPDGVETPSDTIEKTPDLPSRLPPSRVSTWTSTRPRYSYTSRTQDARSEASVKDKIAMFSVETASTDRTDKCSTLPSRTYSTLRKNVTPYKSNYSDITSLDRRLTKSQDNLDETPRSYKRQSDRPEVLGALKSSTIEVTNKSLNKSDISSKPLFYGSTTNLQSDTSFMRPVYHARSISDDNNKKEVPSHKSNLEYLIEQRKKSMSKLRGLVIPEVQTPIVDLPEIKVNDSFSKTYLQNSGYSDSKKQQKLNDCNHFSNVSENKWKSNLLPNNIPKYSPAFKRKSLQVYTSLSKEPTPERKLTEKNEPVTKTSNSPLALNTIKKSFDYSMTPLYKNKNYISVNNYNKSGLNNISMQDYKNVEIKVCTATDIVDSDNDSAMSSTQSSYRSSASSPMHTLDTIESDSSHLSPRLRNYTPYSMVKQEVPIKTFIAEKVVNEDFIKRKVCRSMSSDTNISLSSSSGSAVTSGSQASCSSLESSVADSDKRRVSKTYNVDTINRRNILASAKCRSGRDVKLNSPVFETKFSNEYYNRSPSPINQTSESLSTLTSAVSVIANKGEGRRRNKFILETDSDTDSEKNLRLRKPEYKNTRLKRNSSSCNKPKQNEAIFENGKIEENSNPKDEKVKEIKKNITENGKTIQSFDIKSNKSIIDRKEAEGNCNGKIVQHRFNDIVVPKSALTTNESRPKPKTNGLPSTDQNTVTTSPKLATQTFRLKKGAAAGVGLILAGGTDCEAKDVTVHRVLADGIAARAGIRRGSKVRSINGNLMSGLTHAQSVSILKEQRAEVVIEIENDIKEKDGNNGCGSEDAESKGLGVGSKIKQGAKCSRPVVTVILEKVGGGAGLGFGLDGGRDSPQGDRPLTIKKLFAGGAAAQSGRVMVGAELLSAGGQSMEGHTRTQAWAALKSLPTGPVALVLRNPSVTAEK